MKSIVLSFVLALSAIPMVAQPPARVRQQVQQQTQQQAKKETGVSQRAQLEYPQAPAMDDNVTWRRDLYRVIDLEDEANAALYYPEEPNGDEMNLFTYLFKLVMRKQIPAYNYTLDGNENFSARNQLAPKDILESHHIVYQEKDGRFRIEDSDIPSSAVNTYFIKESTYFDQTTASIRTCVTAICPVRKEADDFGLDKGSYPLFWIKYADVAPFLARFPLMASSYNNAATITADDYFSMGAYKGEIYKTNNLRGRILVNYCESDSALAKERKRIEGELATFESHVWGTDSVGRKRMQATADSMRAQRQSANAKTSAKDEASTSSRSQLKRQRENGGSASKSKSSAAPRVSVRRQRH